MNKPIRILRKLTEIQNSIREQKFILEKIDTKHTEKIELLKCVDSIGSEIINAKVLHMRYKWTPVADGDIPENTPLLIWPKGCSVPSIDTYKDGKWLKTYSWAKIEYWKFIEPPVDVVVES